MGDGGPSFSAAAAAAAADATLLFCGYCCCFAHKIKKIKKRGVSEGTQGDLTR
jgi:hypothetical protein